MNKYLVITFFLSLSGSVLILGICLFHRVVGRKLSMRFRYYIWLVVALRFLIPFNPPFSVLYHVGPGIEEILSLQPAYWNEVYDNEMNDTLISRDQKTANQSGNSVISSFIAYLWTLWAAGVLVLVIRKITVYQSYVKFIRAGRKELANIEQLNFVSEISEELNLHKSVDVYTNEMIASPMIIGIWRPHIVLPTFSLPEHELRHIYRHELTHLKRGDIYYKWLMQIILCLHWFNPFVYDMVRQVNRYCELSCDEAVIAKLNEQQAAEYGTTLLQTLDLKKTYQESIAALTMSENATHLEERLREIKDRTVHRRPFVLPVFMTICLLVGGLLMGAYPYNAVNGYKSVDTAPNLNQAKSELANDAAMALVTSAGSQRDIWYSAGYFLPYMTNEGIDEVVARYNELFPDSAKTAEVYHALVIPSQEETRIRAFRVLYMSNYNFWLAEVFFPYMSEEGIEEVVASYNAATSDNKNPADYY